jgi:hypothetical protein
VLTDALTRFTTTFVDPETILRSAGILVRCIRAFAEQCGLEPYCSHPRTTPPDVLVEPLVRVFGIRHSMHDMTVTNTVDEVIGFVVVVELD